MTIVYTPGAIISLADAKTHLRITSSSQDDELSLYIAATTDIIENIIGPVVTETHVEVYEAADTIVLARAPVIAVTSVVPTFPNVGAYPVSQYQLDAPSGILRRLGSFTDPGYTFQIESTYGYRGMRLTVTYTAGRVDIPAAILLAARLILGDLWTARRGAMPLPARGGGDVETMVEGGYQLPDDAVALLEPFRKAPKVA